MKRHVLFLLTLNAFIFSFYFASCNSLEDDTAPESVSNFSVLAKSESLFLSWTNPEDEDFYGTEIFVSSADKSFVNSYITGAEESSYLIEDLVNGISYSISIYALDQSGNRSVPVAQDCRPTNAYGPCQVKNASLSFDEDTALLKWTNPKDSAFAQTKLLVIKDGGVVLTYTVEKNKNAYSVKNLVCGQKYVFSLVTYDSKGLSSQAFNLEGEVPQQNPDLEFTLSDDKTYYILSGFTGDSTNNRHATPEELKGLVKDGITVNIFSTYEGLPVKEIGREAFKDCHRITKINLPSSIKKIGVNAFQGCTGLKGLKLPLELEQIRDGAFWNCSCLEWFVIPSSLKEIGLGATLGDGLISKIFYTGSEEEWKNLLKNVKGGNPAISASVSSMAASLVFNYDPSIPVEFTAPSVIKNVLAEPGNSHVILSWTNPDDADFNGTYLSVKPAEGSLTEEVFVPSPKNRYVAENLTNGTSYIFSLSASDKAGNRSAPRMTAKVSAGEVTKTSLGFYYVVAKNGCEAIITGRLTSDSLLIIPEQIAGLTVTEIAENAFAGEDFITSVIIPQSIKTVASSAFKGCTGITDIYIAGQAADAVHLKGLTALKALVHENFTYDAEDDTAPAEVADCKILSGNLKLVLVIKGPKDSDYFETLVSVNKENAEVLSFGKNIFVISGLVNGENVKLNLKTKDLYGNISNGIDFYASARDIPFSASTESGFACQLLQDKIYGGTSYVITGFDFMKAHSMDGENLVIPQEIGGVPVTHIGKNAFNGFKVIKDLVIPKNIVDINSKAFESVCVEKFTLEDGNAVFSLNADGTILYRNNYLKKSLVCVSPKISGELDFTASSVKEIEPYAMKGCSLITSVIIGGDTLLIGKEAMADCKALKTVVIPRSVEKIEDNVFEGSKKLSCIHYLGSQTMWNKIEVDLKANAVFESENNLHFEF